VSALERLRQARESGDLQSVIEQIPYARLLGVQCRQLGEELLFVMPRKPDNQGNPSLPAIHG
jgi:hypothetical protein